MVVFKGRKARKLADQAKELADAGKVDEAFARLKTDAPELGAEPWTRFASAMLDAGQPELAERAIDAALDLTPEDWTALVLKVDLVAETGDQDDVIAVYRRLCEVDPKHQGAAVALAELMFEQEGFPGIVAALERFKDNADRKTAFHLGRGFLLCEKPEEAAELLGQVVDELESHIKHAMSRDEWDAAKEELDEAMRWHEEAVSTAYGREEYINIAASKGHLDARAGVNYRLLGLRLMTESERTAEHLDVRKAGDDADEGEQLLKKNKKDVRGHLLLGIGELREGQIGRAKKSFEKACEADGKNFAAFLGLGAAMDAERFGLAKAVRRLPELELGDGVVPVVPDWPNLTGIERKAVAASVYPLRGSLDGLAKNEAKMKILPLDVRTTDLPEFQELEGERAEDDHRSYDAITGMATEHHAVAKIEDLIDVISDNGWIFAHEFAHVVLINFEEELGERVAGLLERAVSIGYVGDEYQRKNIDEFFAVSYTDYLRHRYEIPNEKLMDDQGVMAAFFELFDELANLDDFAEL